MPRTIPAFDPPVAVRDRDDVFEAPAVPRITCEVKNVTIDGTLITNSIQCDIVCLGGGFNTALFINGECKCCKEGNSGMA